jgi:long-chain fatty acid transport protein
MLNPKKSAIMLAVTAAMALPGSAMATNGYFGHGYGVKSKGMGGTGVAMPLDSMDATINPANMVNVGSRIDAGVTWFSPRRRYSVDQVGPFLGPETGAFSLISGQTFDSENENFLVPNFGWNHMIDEVSSFGISVAGNGGMNTEYPNVTFPGNPPGFPTGTYFAGTAGVDLMQLATLVTYARKVNEQVSLGISGIFAFARFKATGVGSFAQFSTSPANVSNKGYETSTGFGVKVGITGDVTDQFALGASYQSKIDMSEFDEYSGLFAEQGDFDVPSTWSIGATFKPAPQHAILLDYQRINYSDTASISNPLFPNLGACFMGDPSSCLGGDNGSGFGWEDLNVYKIGYQYDAGDWQARVGFSTNNQPIPDSETLFNIIAPGVVTNHWTAGFTTKVGKSSSLDFSLMYAPSETVSGGNPLAATPAGNTQIINIEMEQIELGVNYTWTY